MNQQLKVASIFSVTPGPRYRHEGKFSGEEFRTQHLLPMFKAAHGTGEKLTVDFDDVYGYGTSFLEEAFGGLIRIDGFTKSDLDATLHLQSKDFANVIAEVHEYIEAAERQRLGKG